MKVGLISLGCPKNEVDLEYLEGYLEASGHQRVNRLKEADCIIVNTCGFIEPAKEESIQVLLKAAKNKKADGRPLLIAAGCLAKRYAAELKESLPEIDAYISPSRIHQIGDLLKCTRPGKVIDYTSDGNYVCGTPELRKLADAASYAYVKISEGCDNRCSYCAIPSIRGPQKSRRPVEITAEAERIAEKGIKEIILIAQDLSRYGLDIDSTPRLAGLVESLLKKDLFPRVRLMYVNPHGIDEDLMKLYGRYSALCPYIDIPVQHFHPDILKAMNRPVSQDRIRRIFGRLRDLRPDIRIRTSLIAGFPGEKHVHFKSLIQFVEELRPDYLGVFIYSAEEGTPAYELRPRTAKKTAANRHKRLTELQRFYSAERNENLKNRRLEILIDEHEEGVGYLGRTSFQAPEIDGCVIVPGEPAPNSRFGAGDIVTVEITDTSDFDLYGEVKQPGPQQ